MFNVPDDWNSYFRKCSLCGDRYHLSDGGCDCTADLECECGQCDWRRDYDGDLVCENCGGQPWQQLNEIKTKHKARRDHADGTILKGQTYNKFITTGYYPGGRFTYEIQKVITNEPL